MEKRIKIKTLIFITTVLIALKFKNETWFSVSLGSRDSMLILKYLIF